MKYLILIALMAVSTLATSQRLDRSLSRKGDKKDLRDKRFDQAYFTGLISVSALGVAIGSTGLVEDFKGNGNLSTGVVNTGLVVIGTRAILLSIRELSKTRKSKRLLKRKVRRFY